MYVRMYVCMHAHMYVHMYISMYVCMRTCMHMEISRLLQPCMVAASLWQACIIFCKVHTTL